MVALVDVHVGRLAVLVSEVVGCHLVVVWREVLQHLGIGEPPLAMSHAAITVAAHGRFHPLADVLGEQLLVDGLERGIHVVFQHVQSRHARVFLLVGVERVVELVDVRHVVGNEFLPRVVLLVLVGVVGGVEHLLGLGAVLARLGVETADADVVLVFDGAFLCAVHCLCEFLLRILRGAEPHEGEHLAGLEETVLPLCHEVVLHLHLCRAAPAVAVYHAEHIAEHIHHEVHGLVAVVSIADNALARHVVGVVGLWADFGVAELARQVAVVKGNLGERELRRVAVHERLLLVHEGIETLQPVLNEYAVLGSVQNVGNRGLGEGLGVAGLVRKVGCIVALASPGVVALKLATDEHIVHFGNAGVVGLVWQRGKAEDKVLGLNVHFPRALVAELAADERAVAVLAVLDRFLAESQGAVGQRMPGFLAQDVDGCRHALPRVLAAECLLRRCRAVVERDAGIEDTGVGAVFLDLGGGERGAGVRLVAVESHRVLVHRVMVHHVALKEHLRTVGIFLFYHGLITVRQAVHHDQRATSLAASATRKLQLPALLQLVVVAVRDAAAGKFLDGHAKLSAVIHHDSLR